MKDEMEIHYCCVTTHPLSANSQKVFLWEVRTGSAENSVDTVNVVSSDTERQHELGSRRENFIQAKRSSL